MKQLDIRSLLDNNQVFVIEGHCEISRKEFLTRVEKWFAFIKKNLKSEEIICSIELEEIDHMAIFLASALHGKKWVSLNTRLSKNDILLQLQQIPISVYVSNKDLALPGYRALICDEHIDPTSINYTIDSSKDCLLVFTSGSSGIQRPLFIVLVV